MGLIESNLEFIGKFEDRVYYYKNGILTSRVYVKPIQPGTAAQQYYWARWRAGVKAWQNLDTDQKKQLDIEAYRLKFSGFNLWMRRWIEGEVDMIDNILIDTYTGDGTNNRIIDLGDDFDEVYIYLERDIVKEAHGLAQAWAIRQTYGIIFEDFDDKSAAAVMMAGANAYWKGKLYTTGNESKIQLGSAGGNAWGTNKNTWTYRIIAKKFRQTSVLP